jgi:hypothetical protein
MFYGAFHLISAALVLKKETKQILCVGALRFVQSVVFSVGGGATGR